MPKNLINWFLSFNLNIFPLSAEHYNCNQNLFLWTLFFNRKFSRFIYSEIKEQKSEKENIFLLLFLSKSTQNSKESRE